MQNDEFNLGQEIGEIKGGINLLLERTKDLGDIRQKVSDHDRQLRNLRRGGKILGTGVFSLTVAWIKTHLFPGIK